MVVLRAHLHAVWSIGVSIALAEALFPEIAVPVARYGQALISGVLFVLGLVLVHFAGGQGYQLSAKEQLALSLVLIAVIAAVAFLVPGRPSMLGRQTRSAPNPWLAGAVAFDDDERFHGRDQTLGLAEAARHSPDLGRFLLYGLALFAVWHWSRRIGWSAEHRFALAAGALLTYAWYGFRPGPHDALDMIGQAMFALLALGVIVLASRRVRSDRSAPAHRHPSPNAPLDSASRPARSSSHLRRDSLTRASLVSHGQGAD